MEAKVRKRRTVRGNIFWITLTVIFTISYLIWRIGWTIPHDKGTLSLAFWILLLAVEIIGLLEMLVHFYNMYDYDEKKFRKGNMSDKDFPEVDVFIPTLNEEKNLLKSTVNACKSMRSPSKVHVYLCDDGNRDEIKVLADELGVYYLAREEHDFAKAGNLNYALAHSKSPYIAVFDADMMPKEDFLLETIPYFSANKKGSRRLGGKARKKRGNGLVGFVQTPQSFYEADVFQRNLYAEDMIPNEQDYFYRVVQLSKNKSNSVIFGGSNAVLYRKALDEIGGFVTGVLTEDFATGIEIEKCGYRGIATDRTFAVGKTPQDFRAFVRQRRRWARGCIQSGRKTHFLWSKKLTFAQKINYLISISYWYSSWKRLIYFISPLLFAVFGIVVVECTLRQVLAFWLPMYLCCNVCMGRFSHGIRTTRWTNLYETALCPFLLLSVLIESIGIRQTDFQTTDKSSKREERNRVTLLPIPFLLASVVTIYGIVQLLGLSVREETVTYLVVMFWLLHNLYFSLMSSISAWDCKKKKEEKDLASYLQQGLHLNLGVRAFVLHISE